MTKEDYMNAIVDTLIALRNVEDERAKAMHEFREKRKQFEEDLQHYIDKYTGADRQMDLA